MKIHIKNIYPLLLCLIPNMVWAQYESEHEAIANDPYSTGRARKAQVESLWSLSDPNFNFKRVDDKGGWHTEEVNGRPRSINTPRSAAVPRQVSKKRSSGSQTGTHVEVNPNFMKKRRQQIQEAQERAAEEQRRREAERRRIRAANKIKQANLYNAAMSSYRMQNNQGVMESIARLDQIHAVDYANVPQGDAGLKLNTLSGKDMADMLKDKEESGDIEIVWLASNEERPNKQNVSIGQEEPEKHLNLYDDGGYNLNSLNLWEKALLSETPVVRYTTLVRTTQWEKTLLIESEWLNLDSFNITTLPDMGCVALLGDSILLLDNDSLTILKWNVEANVTQVITCGDRVFGKRNNQIVEIKEDDLEVFCELDNDEFSIYQETDSTLVIGAEVFDLFVVTRININTLTYDELLRTPTTIRKVVSNGTVVFVLLKKRIMEISLTPQLFYHSDTRINDICMCRDGLLLATDKVVLLLKSPKEVFTFADEGASHLWCDGTDIYMINLRGDLLRYSKK